MKLEEINKRYFNIPNELKQVNRWICYSIVKDKDSGETKKLPMCAFNGGFAKSNDSNTWTNFNVACMGCEKFNFDGLGFVLGDGFFGIDIDNHPDKNGHYQLTPEQFESLTDEFTSSVNSYTEWSVSGKGIHIICKGTLPEGQRRKLGVPVEMYDSKRFFTVSGNTIKKTNVVDCTESVKELYNKYLFTEKQEIDHTIINEDGSIHFGDDDVPTISISQNEIDDKDLINKIISSKNGQEFLSLYNGDLTLAKGDHSAADLSLCQILAFWTNNNKAQIDRIFRTSALMRKKWDAKRGNITYGEHQINFACNRQVETYHPRPKEVLFVNTSSSKSLPTKAKHSYVDENGDPIFGEIKQIFKHFDFTDTGNAEMFYNYFGDKFRFNTQNDYWHFWNGIKWDRDEKQFIKKYADKIIDLMKKDRDNLLEEFENANEEDPKYDLLKATTMACVKNIQRVSNSAGKDSMLKELQHLHNIPIINKELDVDDFILNTDTGVVNLETGEITQHDKKLLLSKSTNCEIDMVNEPKRWIQFLYEIFDREDKNETREIVDCIQKALGYSLSGYTREQCMFFLWGSGKNGKSVFIDIVNKAVGDYGKSIDSEILTNNKNNSMQTIQFSMSGLLNTRFLSATETEEGKTMAENLIKKMTGDDMVNAQKKFGDEFQYKPKYKIWEATNNLPDIRGGFAIWRRIFLFPFLVNFEKNGKADKFLKEKLLKEIPQILGWMVKGYQKYVKEGLDKPKCIEKALSEYKAEVDVVQKYINNNCTIVSSCQIKARELYEDYAKWAHRSNEHCKSETKFGNDMKSKGFIKKRTGSGYVYKGITLNTNPNAYNFGTEENDEEGE